MSRGPDSSQTTSYMSVSRKRQALWNVLQPGDPYDIRKSMIAKVPGDKKALMGEHLEIVCLFQAAQIERLCEFLDDFKLRYREIERRQLDRHSYEVQIKQLTHKLAEQGGFREQNEKLRDFIKNQSSSKQGLEDSIKSKYQKLLLQIKGFQDQNLRIKRENEQLSFQISSFDAKFQALTKSKQTQLDEMYMKLSQQSNMSSQFEVNSLKSQYESQLQTLSLQNKRIKQINEQRSRDVALWQQKYRTIEHQFMQTSQKPDVYKYKQQLNEYDNRFVIFGQEIDRLNLVIKEITNKFEISEQRNREYQNRYDALNKEYILLQSKSSGNGQQSAQLLKKISDLEIQNRKLQQSGRILAEYEIKLKQMNEQITRLNNQLRLQLQNANRFKSQIQRYQYEQSRINILQKQIFQYKQVAADNNTLKIRIAEDQNRIAILKQEIQRLREELLKRGSEDSNYRSLVAQYQGLQRQIGDWQKKNQITIHDYQTRITQKVTEYESRIEKINRTKGTQFQTRAAMLQSQVQRLNQLLRRKNDEVQTFQRQIRQLEYNITNKYELDTSRKIQTYESGIQTLKRQNEELVRRIRQLQPLQRKVNEYENKITVTSQQIDRLVQQLRTKDNDMQNLRRQIRQQQIAIVQKYEMDTSRKLGNFQQNLNSMTRQNQQWKRKYADIQNKVALLSQQIQRLTNNIRQLQSKNSLLEQQVQRLQRFTKETQINITNKYEFQVNQKVSQYETAIRNFQRDNEELKRRVIELENSNRKLGEYQNRLSMMGQELQRVGVALRQKQEESINLQNNNRGIIREFQELGRKYNELQNTVRNKYEVQTTRTITTLEQNITNFRRQNQELKRYASEYEGRLKGQNNDLEGLTLNIRNFAQQNQALKRQIRQLQSSYRNKLQVQVTGKYHSYESNITELRRDLQNLARQNGELKRVLQVGEQTNIRLNQEKQDLKKRFQQDFGEISKRISEYEQKIHQLQSENQALRRKVHEFEVLIREKYEIQASQKISSLDQNLGNAIRDNEELRRRLEQITRQFQQLRRVAQNMQRDNEQLAKRLRQVGDINRKVVEYENKISLLAQELQRTNVNLKAKVDQLNKGSMHIQQLTRELELSRRNITQSQSSIQQFQVEVKTRITQYEQNITILTQQNGQLKRRLHILDDMNRKIAEYENKIVILNQQLERVNQNLRNQLEKATQLQNALRKSTGQNQQLRRTLIELQNNIAQKYEVEAARAIRTLEQNIQALQRENNQLKAVLHEFQQKGNNQNLELQKLTTGLKTLTQQNNLLRNQIRETEINITRKYESQVTSKYSSYEQNITTIKRQNQQLVRRLRQMSQRVIPQYENQIAILRQEIQRLNQHLKQQSGQLTLNLRNISQENDALKRQILQIQQSITQKYQVEVTKKYSSYEKSIGGLQKENDELKRYINEMGGKYQGELKGIGQNFTLLQRENQQLKRAIQEISSRYQVQIKKTGSFEQNLGNIGRQNQELKKRLVQIQQEMQRLIRKLNQLQQENQTIRRQAKQGQLQITQRYQSQTSQQINIYKQQFTQVQSNWHKTQRQNQQLQRQLNDMGGDANRKITKHVQEIRLLKVENQRLNAGIREYDSKIRELATQNDLLRRQVKQTEVSITQRWQSEYRSKTASYEQNMQKLTRQVQQRQKGIYDASNKRIMELENKTALLSQQLQRLNISLRTKSQDNEKMRLQIQRLNNTLRLKLEQTKVFETQLHKFRSATQSQFSQLQSSYTVISKQNQNYKKHLTDYESSIKKLYAEFQRLQNIINDLKKEREALFEKNFALSNEIDRLLSQNKDLETQVEDVRLRLSDEAALHKRINEHMALMVILFAEIQSLRKRVKDKQKQVQDVRRSSLAPFKLESRARNDSL